MTDRVVPGPVDNACDVREAVAIHTKKIYSSCRDKDCIEDLRFYPTICGQSVISTAQGIKGGSAELLYVYIDVEPVTFNRGFYTVDMRYFYRVTLQVLTGGPRYTEVDGLCVFDKRVILFGSEGSAKIFSSATALAALDQQLLASSNRPTAVVEAVAPIVLDTKLVECCAGRCCECGITEVPAAVAASFTENLVVEDAEAGRRVYVTLGQFSIVRLERDTQLLIPVYDYSIPENECTSGSGDDPCELFDSVEFPVNEFFPPNTMTTSMDYNCTRSASCR